MIIVLWILLGMIISSCLWFFLLRRSKLTLSELNDKTVRLEQEKEIVVDFMHNLAVAIGEGIAKKDLYHRIAHTAVITTGAMSACIYEKLQNGRLQGVAVEGLFPPQRAIKSGFNEDREEQTRASFIEKILNSEILEDGEGIVGEVSKTGKAVFVKNAVNDPRITKHSDPTLVVRSIIFSPMLYEDRTVGILAVANPANGLCFSETDFSLVNSIAEQAALALRNSDAMNLRLVQSRMDSDLQLAREVQELFLDEKFPECKGLELSAHYVPSAEVSGDFYDFKKLSPNKFALAIADVSGKGVPASLLMALCQTNLRHYLTKSSKPSEVLAKLNYELENRIRDDMFITIFLAIVDARENTICYARAGHEPALLARASKDRYEVMQLKGSGMAVGMVSQEIFEGVIEDKVVDFNPGDLLFLYTDGITESTNQEQEEFGIERLSQQIKNYSNLEPKLVNERVVSQVDKFSNLELDRDDLTIFSAKRI